MNKKMKIIRSRSAERLQRYVRPESLYVGQCEPMRQTSETTSVRQARSTHRARIADKSDYSGPTLGQARALVSCVPSPYDIDVLAFQVKIHQTFYEVFSLFFVNRSEISTSKTENIFQTP